MLSFIALAGSVAAYNVSFSTEVVSSYTTFVPSATSFVEGSSTYVITAPTTLTVTDCPCTRTHTFSTATVTVCPSSVESAGSVPQISSGTAAAPKLANSGKKNSIPVVAAVLGAAAIANLL